MKKDISSKSSKKSSSWNQQELRITEKRRMTFTSGRVELDFVTQVGGLPPASIIRFYEILAHNLTVSIRSIWSDDSLYDFQKVERMKWINEFMHRVVTRSAALRRNQNEYSEADTWAMLEHYVTLCPAIAGEVATATIGSYQIAELIGEAE